MKHYFPREFMRCGLVVMALSLSVGSMCHAGGSVVAWGYYYDLSIPESYRPMYVPAGLTNVVAIAAGGQHALALKSDGKVVAWGDSNNGKTNVPTSLTNAIAISAGVVTALH